MSWSGSSVQSGRVGNFLRDLEMLHSLSSRLDTGYATDTTTDISTLARRRAARRADEDTNLHYSSAASNSSNESTPSLTSTCDLHSLLTA
ncbi:unnamed protein product [Chrysodeixis includens]|uniref:Uncharacterized protein n=1 Tax=Chrysodeixis includens TaxID=689277 RepID=A0A9N8KYV7_CHRIL|nr:unnamed protein product [Chrysodeixis includens]